MNYFSWIKNSHTSRVLLTVLILASSGCRYENVDQDPAVQIGTNFYGALKSGKVKESLALFAPEFKKSESDWPRLIHSMQAQAGLVTSAELQSSQILAKDDLPCWLLDYSVKRPSVTTNESLFVCRTPDKKNWHISGHKLTRLDTNQTITGGIFPVTVGISIP